jgi:hypothetical protein
MAHDILTTGSTAELVAKTSDLVERRTDELADDQILRVQETTNERASCRLLRFPRIAL